MTVIKRRPKAKQEEPFDDAMKFRILEQYGDGVPVATIATNVSRDRLDVTKFIQGTLRKMNVVRETNDLIVSKGNPVILANQVGPTPTKYITSSFLSLIETNGDQYAYYFAKTRDNNFALEQSGLDVGIPKTMKRSTKDYVRRIRGQFLREMPAIAAIIKAEWDKQIHEYNVEKPEVQMMIMRQIEELQELAANDTRQRSNLLKSIEMLGRSIGAFTDRVELDETNAKSGLEMLMEKAKGEVYEYKQEDK